MEYIRVTSVTDDLVAYVKAAIESIPSHDGKAKEPHAIRRTLTQIINDPRGLCIVAVEGEVPQGMLLAQCAPEIFSDELVAMCILWYAPNDPRLAKRLSGVFEKWAYGIEGVKRLQYASPCNDRLDKLYLRKGFRLVERAYHKEI